MEQKIFNIIFNLRMFVTRVRQTYVTKSRFNLNIIIFIILLILESAHARTRKYAFKKPHYIIILYEYP